MKYNQYNKEKIITFLSVCLKCVLHVSHDLLRNDSLLYSMWIKNMFAGRFSVLEVILPPMQFYHSIFSAMESWMFYLTRLKYFMTIYLEVITYVFNRYKMDLKWWGEWRGEWVSTLLETVFNVLFSSLCAVSLYWLTRLFQNYMYVVFFESELTYHTLCTSRLYFLYN